MQTLVGMECGNNKADAGGKTLVEMEIKKKEKRQALSRKEEARS